MTPAASRTDVVLAPYTTLRLGGAARRFVDVGDERDLVAEVCAADRRGEPVLVLGGGSNLVIADAGFAGAVMRVATRGVAVERDTDASAIVRARAGEDWDALVARCVEDGLSGIECLSGIPGKVGATPIQNVGAYGQEIAQALASVRALDRSTGEIVTLAREDCAFSYRNSAFKGNDRHLILEVTLELERAPLSAPMRYAELARALGIELGERAPLADARAAVLALRRGKGMVIDPGDPDTRSAGSFFTNPVLDPEQFRDLEKRVCERLGPDTPIPRYPADGDRIKTSAAWLIERAGFGKGYARGPVRISTKHTLALTNADSARTEDLLALAREVRDGVREAFGVELVNEPVMVGVML